MAEDKNIPDSGSHEETKSGDGAEESTPRAESGGDLEEKLKRCEKDKSDYLSGWQRAKADFINYKRDEAARFEQIAKYANEGLLNELILVLDNFDLGLRSLEKNGVSDRGIYLIRIQLEDIMKKRGLEKISIAIGSMFDPSTSEILAESDSDKPQGVVLEEIAPAYELYDKIIRPAKVKISKGTAAN